MSLVNRIWHLADTGHYPSTDHPATRKAPAVSSGSPTGLGDLVASTDALASAIQNYGNAEALLSMISFQQEDDGSH